MSIDFSFQLSFQFFYLLKTENRPPQKDRKYPSSFTFLGESELLSKFSIGYESTSDQTFFLRSFFEDAVRYRVGKLSSDRFLLRFELLRVERPQVIERVDVDSNFCGSDNPGLYIQYFHNVLDEATLRTWEYGLVVRRAPRQDGRDLSF